MLLDRKKRKNYKKGFGEEKTIRELKKEVSRLSD